MLNRFWNHMFHVRKRLTQANVYSQLFIREVGLGLQADVTKQQRTSTKIPMPVKTKYPSFDIKTRAATAPLHYGQHLWFALL